jgi:DNA-binding transcriptional regulator of glucitol operon
MRRLASPGWLLVHAVALALVVAFVVLGWWQLDRAKDGNALSFGYTLEWPFFAAFVVFMWQREARAALRAGRDPEPPTPVAPEPMAPGVTRFDVNAALAQRAERDRALHQSSE